MIIKKNVGNSLPRGGIKAIAGLCLGLGLCYGAQAMAAPASWTAPKQAWQSATLQGPLPAEEAFRTQAIATGKESAMVRLAPAPGYYLYQERTSFVDQDGKPTSGRWPAGETHDDPHFGKTTIHRQTVDVELQATSAPLRQVTVSFQGCQDQGICYPPMVRTLPVVGADASTGNTLLSEGINGASAKPVAPPDQGTAPDSRSMASEPLAEDESWAAVFTQHSIAWILGAFFLGGLFLSMTPCVLPMVPVVLGLLAPRANGTRARQGLGAAAAYVFANASVLALAGSVGAAMGGGMGLVQAMQQPTFLGLGAGLFALLGAWQAGWIGQSLGSGVLTRIGQRLDQLPQGRWWSALGLGAGSALILGPCVAPPAAGAVLFVAQQGSWALGAGALFAMGVGLGVPLLLLAAGWGRWMPRTGQWMVYLSRVGAMGLLGVGAMLADRATAGAFMPLWITAWGSCALCLWKPMAAPKPLLAGAAMASMALVFVALPKGERQAGHRLVFETVTPAALATLLQSGEPVMLDLSANWCGSCQEMEKTTFANADVAKAAQRFRTVRLNLDEIDSDEQTFLQAHQLIGPPAVLFFDRAGTETRHLRLVGPETPARFIERLNSQTKSEKKRPVRPNKSVAVVD